MSEPPKPTPRPDRVGPYLIAEAIGGGAMGEVFLAHDERLHRPVALKRIQPDRHDSESLARFRREAKAAARLDHRSIVQIHDWLETEDGTWLVMEYVEGEPLSKVLARGPLDPLEAVKLAKKIAEGLVVAHAAGIVHRDLKASNIMLTEDGVKILDFGLAKRLPEHGGDETGVTSEGQLIGTIVAMAPEQAMGRQVDARTDLFALGMLLYEMLAGQSPFRRRSALATLNAICDDAPERLSSLAPGLPPELVALVHQLLAKDPRERPASAREVADRLRLARSALGGSSAGYSTGLYVPPPPWWRRRGRFAWAGLVVAVIAVVAALLFVRGWLQRPPPRQEAQVRAVSLAVLPVEFEGVREKSFAAESLAEDVVSSLWALDKVMVLSLSSTEKLRRQEISPEEIRLRLRDKADLVLEGSLEWPEVEGAVTVRAKLLRTADGEVLWSRSLRRPAETAHELAIELASEVASRLPVVSPRELEELRLGRVDSTEEARDAFAEGRDWERQVGFSKDALEHASEAYGRAVEGDPEFVEALSRLIRVETLIYFNGKRSPEKARQIEGRLAELQQLAPNRTETRIVAAEVAYRVQQRYDEAEALLRKVLEEEPNNRLVLATLGYIVRRQGHLEETIELLSSAFELDPLNAELPAEIANTYRAERRFRDAELWFRRSLGMDAGVGWVRGQAALNAFALEGCSRPGTCAGGEALAILERAPDPRDPEVALHRFWLDLYLAPPDEKRALEAALERYESAELGKRSLWLPRLGLAHYVHTLRAVGRGEEALRLLRREHGLLRDELILDPDYPGTHANLALVLALLEGPEGIEEIQEAAWKAVELAQNDRFTGPRHEEHRALALLLAGEVEQARLLVERLLGEPYQRGLTRQALALDPLWRPLRRQAPAR